MLRSDSFQIFDECTDTIPHRFAARLYHGSVGQACMVSAAVPCFTVLGSPSDRAHETRVPLDKRSPDKC